MTVSVSGVSLSLGGRVILRDVSFQASSGEFVAVAGPNGAGKSTLLRALAGLAGHGRPDPKRVAYLPQGARSAWGMRVRDLVALGRLPWDGADPHGVVDGALQACGLAALAECRIDRLSGGQARRAMLARTLATQAEILLLDEPVADLDPAACHDIMQLLRRFTEAGGCVVAVLHALELAMTYATRMTVMQDGCIVADAPPHEALAAAAYAFGMAVNDQSRPLLEPMPQTKECA